MAPKFPQSKTVIIPANGKLGVTLSGTSWYIFSATGSLTVAPNGGVPIPHVARTGITNSDFFERLELNDTSGADNTVIIVCGVPQFVDNRIT